MNEEINFQNVNAVDVVIPTFNKVSLPEAIARSIGIFLDDNELKIKSLNVVRDERSRNNIKLNIDVIFSPIDEDTDEMKGGRILGRTMNLSSDEIEEYKTMIRKMDLIVKEPIAYVKSKIDKLSVEYEINKDEIKDLNQDKYQLYNFKKVVTDSAKAVLFSGHNLRRLISKISWEVEQYCIKYENLIVEIGKCRVSFQDKKSKIRNKA